MFELPGEEKSDWAEICEAVEGFNQKRRVYVSTGLVKVLDKMMCAWRPQKNKFGGLLHLSWIKRKPKPFGKSQKRLTFSAQNIDSLRTFVAGTKFKSVCCAQTGIMLQLEIQEGKDQIKHKEFVGQMKAQAACTKRLATASATHNNKNADNDNIFIGDSWFTSVESALSLIAEGYKFAGVVKNCHSSFPCSQLKALMSKWPGGSYVVFTSDNLVATGYKYKSKKVISFLSLKCYNSTEPGDPYVAWWADKNDNLTFRDVAWPKHLSKYFAHCNAIDAHNQARQGVLALEEHWTTHCPWFCLLTFFIGVNVTDTWKATKYAVPANDFFASVSIKQFAKLMAMEMIINTLDKNNYGGKKLIQKPLIEPTQGNPVKPAIVLPASVDNNGYAVQFLPPKKDPRIGSIVNGKKIVDVVGEHFVAQTSSNQP